MESSREKSKGGVIRYISLSMCKIAGRSVVEETA